MDQKERHVYAPELGFEQVLPAEWGSLSIDETLQEIPTILDPLTIDVGQDRLREWKLLDSILNPKSSISSRRRNGYYDSAVELQALSDLIFKSIYPEEDKEITRILGEIEDRWLLTSMFARDILRAVKEPTKEEFTSLYHYNRRKGNVRFPSEQYPDKPKKLIVHGRAKSNFSIWAKCEDHRVDPEEITDIIGVQVLVENDDHAREIMTQLLAYSDEHPEKFTLMEDYTFNRVEERAKINKPAKHTAIRPYLDKPNQSNYRAIRMNFVNTATSLVFEVQITPIDVYALPKAYETRLSNRAKLQRQKH